MQHLALGRLAGSQVVGTPKLKLYKDVYNSYGRSKLEVCVQVDAELQYKWPERDAAQFAKGFVEIISPAIQEAA